MERDPFTPPNPPALSAARLLARKEQVMTAFHEQHDPEPQTTSAQPATTWPRRRRYLAMAGASAALAATVAVLPSLFTATATPAYALTANEDGSVTFVINDITDTKGATRALRKAGVRAVVLPGQPAGTCPAGTKGTEENSDFLTLVKTFTFGTPSGAGGTSLVIRPDNIPDSTVLVITAVPPAPTTWRSTAKLFMSAGLYREPAPTCAELPTPGPGNSLPPVPGTTIDPVPEASRVSGDPTPPVDLSPTS